MAKGHSCAITLESELGHRLRLGNVDKYIPSALPLCCYIQWNHIIEQIYAAAAINADRTDGNNSGWSDRRAALSSITRDLEMITIPTVCDIR